eukprot:5949534-Alexandrium_andersonii.AAC.1
MPSPRLRRRHSGRNTPTSTRLCSTRANMRRPRTSAACGAPQSASDPSRRLGPSGSSRPGRDERGL